MAASMRCVLLMTPWEMTKTKAVREDRSAQALNTWPITTARILRRSQNMGGGCAQGLSRLLPSGSLSTLLLCILSLSLSLSLFVCVACVLPLNLHS